MTTSSISGISFSGIVSGVDTDSIIEKLMTLERIPQTLVSNKVDDYTAKKSVYSQLSTKLSSLQTAIDTINDIADPLFSTRAANNLAPEVVEASLTGTSPSLGTYELTVSQLASAALVGSSEAIYTGADRVAQAASAASSAAINLSPATIDPTQSLASQSAAFGTAPDASGTLTINGTSLDWDSSMSLNEIIGRINNLGVGATARFDASTQTLSIASSDKGSTAELVIGESAGNFLEACNLTAGTYSGTDAVTTDLGAALGDASANLDVAATSGTFTINGVIFNVDAGTDTLQSVLVRINSSDAGVTANYNSATGRVSLTQKETGADNSIVLGASGDTSNLLYALKLSANNPPTGAAADTYSGTDAVVSFNGGSAQSFSSNIVDELVTGVTFNIHSTGTATVQVEADVDGMVEAVGDFVDAYNEVMDYINTVTQETRVDDPATAEERIQGTFSSDRNFTGTKADLTAIVSSVVGGLPNTLNQLAQIGITGSADNFGKDAKLELDETKLKAALVNDPEAVGEIFNSSGTGIMPQLTAKLDSLTDIVTGALTVEDNALDANITRLNEQIETMEALLEQREAAMKLQFANMETMVAELKSDGDRLTALLGTSS